MGVDARGRGCGWTARSVGEFLPSRRATPPSLSPQGDYKAVSNRVSLVCTDEHAGYRFLGRDLPHGISRKSDGTYVVGAVHTNTIEGIWSILKRGVVGTFHKVSRKYMPFYVAEFQFRCNNRANPDIFGAAIAGC